MRQFLLGLVVFVLYLIQAQGDFEHLTFDPEVEDDINKHSNEVEKSKKRELYLQVFKMGKATGFKMGNATGYSDGYASAEGLGFMNSFECVTHGLKGVLEDSYQCGEKIIPSNVINKYENLQIPEDILNTIETKDGWVRTFNFKKNYQNTPLEMDNTMDSFEAIIATTNKPSSIDSYKAAIKKSFQVWYALLKLKRRNHWMPVFVSDLQDLLKEFQEKNLAEYKDIDEVHIRFAAQIARSYKMMCALHHQLNNIMRDYAERNTEMCFSKILFKFAPGWHMSQEQFEFLNILRQTIPDRLRSMKYICLEHGKDNWVVVPYDNSEDCGRIIFKNLPTIPINLLKLISVAPTITFAPDDED